MAQFKPSVPHDLRITCVKGEGSLLKFWAWRKDNVEIVNFLEKQLSQLSAEFDKISGFLTSNQVRIGFRGAVHSRSKYKWCRAQVRNILDNYNVLIHLLDYGDEEIVSVVDLRTLDESFFAYPPQAFECILADVLPILKTEWSTSAVQFCKQQLIDKTVLCHIVTHFYKVPVVRIALLGEKNPFSQRLIDNGLALIKTETQPTPPPVQVLPQQMPMQSIPVQQVMSYPTVSLPPNTDHLVKVSFIESLQNLYIQLCSSESKLRELMDELKKYVNSENLSFLQAPIVNTPCLATFSAKQQIYYRGLIISTIGGKCQVLFVDYGCMESKDFQELRAIPLRFLSYKPHAICCSLTNTVDIDCEEFFRIARGNVFRCHVLGHNGSLHFVTLTRILSSYKPADELGLNKGFEMTVSYTNDIADFYCQMAHSKKDLDMISGILNSPVYEPIALAECVPNLPVCVKFSEDNLWYRAKILKVNHEHDIEVFFVDYGNSDNATLKDISTLKPELLAFPVQAFKCCLFEVESSSEPSARDEMFEIFEELTARKVLRVEIQSIIKDQCYVVTLCEKNSPLTINEKINLKFTKIGKVMISSVEKLYVTSFDSPSSFYTQFEKLSTEDLDEMQAQMNEFYLGNRNTTFRPNVGSFVCAKYDADGQFYRAIIENINGHEYEVCFIDYGNKESISFQSVYPLHKNFTKLPQFGVECSLENCPPATPVDKVEGLMLENSIEAKMIKEVEGNWIISLTEDFPGNVAILELLRQHEKIVPRSIRGAGLHGFQENVFESQMNKVDNYSRVQDSFQDTYKPSMPKRNDSYPHQSESPLPTPPEKKSLEAIMLPPKAYRNVYISHVKNPGEFFCQIEEDSSKLKSLMKDIEDTYSNSGNQFHLTDLKTDTFCCAVFEDDECWYRGQIKQVGHSASIVYFIDYGNTDAVQNSKIKQLQPKFYDLSPQGIRCKSNNLAPNQSNWTDDDISKFINMTLGKSFVAQFVEADSNSTYSVNLVSIGKLEKDLLSKEFVSLGHGHLQNVNKTIAFNSYAASSNLTYNKISIEDDSYEAVNITYGLNPGEIFCQLQSHENEFKHVMGSLQDYYNKTSTPDLMIDRPLVGMICVAQFFLDSAWYRGEIKKVDKNSLSVLYVDYGNCEKVDKKNVRCIIQDFTVLPIQGVKCRINGIKPVGCSWPSNQSLSKYYEGNAKCHFISQKDDYYFIDLVCNQQDVAERLIADGIAKKDATAGVSSALTALTERKDSFVCDQLLSVVVSYVENPRKFWCQLTDEAEILEQLMADIESQYLDSNVVAIKSSDLKIGNYCMAQYSEDEAWYRAQIKSCPSSNSCEVFFIDYGNFETTSMDKLATILPNFLTTPSQCFECCLVHAPPVCERKKTEAFQNITNTVEEFTARIDKVEKAVCVISLLYETDGGELNVSKELGFSAETSVTEDFPKYNPPEIFLGSREGYVTEVNSPHDFFIQLAACEDSLATLSTELSDHCEASVETDATFHTPCIGCACAAKYSEDDSWYRAQIIGIQGNSADVLFVDYGNKSSVTVDSLKVLPQNFLEIPPYAIKCKLNGISSKVEQWTETAISSFQDMINEELLNITFISKDSPVVVNISMGDKDIAQTLIDSELACVETCPEIEEAYTDDHLTTVDDQLHSLPSDLSFPKRKLCNSKLKAKICYTDTYNKFFIMPLELTTELDTIMKTLEILYSDDSSTHASSILEDVQVSLPCVAKYREDDAWYRAIITEVDKENIYVSFVDYGNSELTSLQNLRPITPELIKIPPIALRCKLFGIDAIEGKESDIAAKLEEFYLDEIELDMEVIKCNGLYEVKLCHEEDLGVFFCKEGLAGEIEAVEETLLENLGKEITEDLKIAFVELSEETVNYVSLKFLATKEKTSMSMKFTVIEDDIIFYAVPTELEDELASFQERMQSVYNDLERNIAQTNVKDFCVAKYAEDESWYRVQILSCNDDELKVQFIDYGNTESVNVSDINELLPEFKNKPQFCVKLYLTGLKVNKERKDELQEKLDEILYSDTNIVNICNSCSIFHGTCIKDVVFGENSLVEMLLSEKFVSQEFIVHRSIKNQFEATIQSFIDDTLYMLPIKFIDDLNALQSTVNNVCCDLNSKQVESVDTSRLYAAKIDNKWYRVAINMNIELNNSIVNLKLVDYGVEKEIDLSQLTALPVDLCHCPLLLQPCKLLNTDNFPHGIAEESLPELQKKIYQCELQEVNSLTYPLQVKLFEKSAFSKLEEINSETLIEESSQVELTIEKENVTETLVCSPTDADLQGSIFHEPCDEDIINVKGVVADNTPGCSEADANLNAAAAHETCDEDTDIPDLKVHMAENTPVCSEHKAVSQGSTVNEPCDEDTEHITDLNTDVTENISVYLEDMQGTTAHEPFHENSEDIPDLEEIPFATEQIIKDPPDAALSEEKAEVNGQLSNIETKEIEGRECDNAVTQKSEDSFPDPNLANIESSFDEKSEDSVNIHYQVSSAEGTETDLQGQVNNEEIEETEDFDANSHETDEDSVKKHDEDANVLGHAAIQELEKSTKLNDFPANEIETNALSESDASFQLSINISGPSGDMAAIKDDLDEKQDSEVEDNFHDEVASVMCNENKISFPIAAVPDPEQNEIDVNISDCIPIEDDCDERPECDIKQDSTTEDETVDNILDEPLISEDEQISEKVSYIDTLKEKGSKYFTHLNKENYENIHLVDSNGSFSEVIPIDNNNKLNFPYNLSGKVDVHVSCVDYSKGSILLAITPQDLFLDLKSNFNKDMQDVYSTEKQNLSDFSVLNICAVLCDGFWYRGKILQFVGQELTVLLIDHGSCKTVLLSEAKELEERHKNVPPYIAWCTPTNLYCPPEKWDEAKIFINQNLSNIEEECKSIFVEVLEQDADFYKVNLFFNNENFAYQLLLKNFVVQQLADPSISNGKYNALISHLNRSVDDVNLYIRLAFLQGDYLQLKKSMEDIYCAMPPVTLQVQINFLYAVAHKNSWARGKAVSYKDEVHLFLVDTGEVIGTQEEVHLLLPEHCINPPFAIPCEIHEKMMDVLEAFVDVYSTEEFTALVERNSETKSLFATIIVENLIESMKNLLDSDSEAMSIEE